MECERRRCPPWLMARCSERVFYPITGTTKLDVIRYYADVSLAMLPHVQGRPATRKRWPGGVEQTSFFVKDLQPGTPRPG